MSDGVLLVQKLLKLFPLDPLRVPYKHNELAAILRGEFSKTVLSYTKINRDPCRVLERQGIITRRA